MSKGVLAPVTNDATLSYPAGGGVVAPVRQHSTNGWWQRFVSWIWDRCVFNIIRHPIVGAADQGLSDYYEKSNAERKLVHKLDCAILSCIAFGYWMKYIDQTKYVIAHRRACCTAD
jgi:hypothetical protein